MNELREYLNNLNLTSGAEDFIAAATDEELEELFDIEEIEEEGDFGNAKALYVESVIDAYTAID